MSGLLEIANLELSYGERVVLRSVTFHAKQGEFLALVGVNGAGKSTILDIIAGFRKPDSGSVVIAGRDQKAWSLRELAQRVSHLLLRAFLDRCGGAGIGQRQRLSALGWSSNNEQCANSGKP